MKIRTTARDCLYLNWALPLEWLPEAPAPLRYEVHKVGCERFVFASALLFRQQGLRLAGLPWVRFSYPQLNLRLYVRDRDGTPGVLFRRMLVPAWVVPGARIVSRQAAEAARLEFPVVPEGESPDGGWSWSASKGAGELTLSARLAMAPSGAGPGFPSWEASIEYFRGRERGFTLSSAGLREVSTSQPQVAVWPMAAEIHCATLLEESLGHAPWPALHSAFLCPEIPFTFELSAPKVPLLTPATGQVKAAADPAMLRRRRDRVGRAAA